MKKRFSKFVLPIVLGIALTVISIIGFVSCVKIGCGSNELEGDNGDCMTCNGNTPSYNWYPGCSNVNNGVYCCR